MKEVLDMMSWLSALYTYSLQYQVNKNNVFYVQYWIFDNCYLSNYPAIRNIFGVNQIIRYRYNEDPAITNNFFGTVALRFSGVPLYQNSYLAAKLRACLHGGGGPQTSEVTYGWSPHIIKLKWEIIWTGGLLHQSGLPHLPGVPTSM